MTKPSDFTEALTSPSVARNRDPILSVLRRVLPPTGQVLEIASGTGEHAVHFAAALPHLTWQPTDRDEQALKSIAAHRAASGLPNLLAPLFLDAAAPEWPVERADAISAINMVHISPWQATQGLMAGAGAPPSRQPIFVRSILRRTVSTRHQATQLLTWTSGGTIRNGVSATWKQ